MAGNSKVRLTRKSRPLTLFRPHTIRLQDKHDDLDMKALNIKGRLVDSKAYRQSFLDTVITNRMKYGLLGRSETKSAKRSFASNIRIRNIFTPRYAQPLKRTINWSLYPQGLKTQEKYFERKMERF